VLRYALVTACNCQTANKAYVKALRLWIIIFLLGRYFYIYQLFALPEHAGHKAVGRSRTYIIASHKSKSVYLYDVFECYNSITSQIKKHVATRVRDYLIATPRQIALDSMQLAAARGIPYRPDSQLHASAVNVMLLTVKLFVSDLAFRSPVVV
jgi:hypothetical protein